MWTARGGQVLVAFPAAVPLNLGVAVTHDPIPFDPQQPDVPAQPGHAFMALETNQQCIELAAASRIVSRGRRV